MKKILSLGLLAALTLAAVVPMTASANDMTEELQAAVAELSAEQQAALYLLLTQLGGGESGEAAAAGASPEEQAEAAIHGFVAAGAEGDYDKMLEVFSDDFEHYEYGDKEGVGEFLSQAADMGYLEGIEVVLEDAEYKVDGDTLSVYPVEFNGAFGSITFEYIFKNEDGTWKIVEFDASGL